MRLSDITFKFNCDKYWLFIAYMEDNPHESVMCLCDTEQKARHLMDKYLPIETELQTIQKQHNETQPEEYRFTPLPREQLLKLGFFFNPFSTADSLYYNGYYTFYAVKQLSVNEECTLSLERE